MDNTIEQFKYSKITISYLTYTINSFYFLNLRIHECPDFANGEFIILNRIGLHLGCFPGFLLIHRTSTILIAVIHIHYTWLTLNTIQYWWLYLYINAQLILSNTHDLYIDAHKHNSLISTRTRSPYFKHNKNRFYSYGYE